MNLITILVVLAVLAAIAAAAFWWMKIRKEKFVMQIYRPTYVTSIPATTFDPADILTAVMPSGMHKPPKLAVELGDYRRFRRT
jgi:hypothetical protein